MGAYCSQLCLVKDRDNHDAVCRADRDTKRMRQRVWDTQHLCERSDPALIRRLCAVLTEEDYRHLRVPMRVTGNGEQQQPRIVICVMHRLAAPKTEGASPVMTVRISRVQPGDQADPLHDFLDGVLRTSPLARTQDGVPFVVVPVIGVLPATPETPEAPTIVGMVQISPGTFLHQQGQTPGGDLPATQRRRRRRTNAAGEQPAARRKRQRPAPASTPGANHEKAMEAIEQLTQPRRRDPISRQRTLCVQDLDYQCQEARSHVVHSLVRCLQAYGLYKPKVTLRQALEDFIQDGTSVYATVNCPLAVAKIALDSTELLPRAVFEPKE